jgi:hypothetical protein
VNPVDETSIAFDANDFHKNIKVFRNDRLVWACHHEGSFNNLSQLNDQLAENECIYKQNEVEVFGVVQPPPP